MFIALSMADMLVKLRLLFFVDFKLMVVLSNLWSDPKMNENSTSYLENNTVDYFPVIFRISLTPRALLLPKPYVN